MAKGLNLGKNGQLGFAGVALVAEYNAVHYVTKGVVEYFKNYLGTPVKDWAPTVVATGVTAVTAVFVGNKLGFGGEGKEGSLILAHIKGKDDFIGVAKDFKAHAAAFVEWVLEESSRSGEVNQGLAESGIKFAGDALVFDFPREQS